MQQLKPSEISDLIKSNLFPELNKLHPGRIINQTNGVTPRRWLKMANRHWNRSRTHPT